VLPTGKWGENDTWMRTIDLDSHTRVMVGNWAYHVIGVKSDPRGYLVELERMKTHKRAIICISHANVYRRYWKPYRFVPEDHNA
jgi:hypothetical protein